MESGVVAILRDDQDWPPEVLLQAIWQNQRLLRDTLRTVDGQPVRVLHPGFRSVEGGPDFRGAVVRIGDAAPVTGDVEVDVRWSGWRAHGHDRNPAFSKVILHVIWDAEKSTPRGNVLPVLAMRGSLDSPLGHLSFWFGADRGGGPDLPEAMRGRCLPVLRDLGNDRVLALLREAADIRLYGKAAQFEARARQVGWDQAFWEGLFRALGYKHNSWPMQRLGELRPLWRDSEADLLTLQARLFGIGGLLPADITRMRSSADAYLRRVWDRWWRDRDYYAEVLLPREVWRLHGLRPANHPQRRLALASLWSQADELPRKVEKWCADGERESAAALEKLLAVGAEAFWSWHWNFKSARLARPQPLIGGSRVSDMAVNVFLPWLLARALEGDNEAVASQVRSRYFDWPAAQDNSVLRLARQRLFGTVRPTVPFGAALQQGLLQIVRDFCDHSNAVCDGCKFPELARAAAVARRPAPAANG